MSALSDRIDGPYKFLTCLLLPILKPYSPSHHRPQDLPAIAAATAAAAQKAAEETIAWTADPVAAEAAAEAAGVFVCSLWVDRKGKVGKHREARLKAQLTSCCDEHCILPPCRVLLLAQQQNKTTITGSKVDLEWSARGILKLASKVALLITMNVLADVLVDNTELKKQLMDDAGSCWMCCVCVCMGVRVRVRVCMCLKT